MTPQELEALALRMIDATGGAFTLTIERKGAMTIQERAQEIANEERFERERSRFAATRPRKK